MRLTYPAKCYPAKCIYNIKEWIYSSEEGHITRLQYEYIGNQQILRPCDCCPSHECQPHNFCSKFGTDEMRKFNEPYYSKDHLPKSPWRLNGFSICEGCLTYFIPELPEPPETPMMKHERAITW